MHTIIHSIDSLQIFLVKAMMVDQEKLIEYQKDDEIILVNRLFNNTLILADFRPIVAMARNNKKLLLDPVEAYIKSGYQAKIKKERK